MKRFTVVYCAAFYPDYDSVVEKSVGKTRDGSGMYFSSNERDLEFSFRDAEKAKTAFRKAKRLSHVISVEWAEPDQER